MSNRNKIYFASDFHLGMPNHAASLEREKRIVRWLDSISTDAEKIFLLGDVFDFWYEYKYVVPKGYVRLLGKLAELKDKGIDVQVFTGNHDLWMFGYFPNEMQIPIHHKPLMFEASGKKFFIGHGDGLGPGDRGYKLMKNIFTNKICQWLFSLLHPRIAFSIAMYFSRNSRLANEEETFLGEDKEWQILFAKEKLKSADVDYFIFGHRHIALQICIAEKTTFINLGDWIRFNTYAVFDGSKIELRTFEK
jgi:UDP-2,3-diacylglucosamine hydrolase